MMLFAEKVVAPLYFKSRRRLSSGVSARLAEQNDRRAQLDHISKSPAAIRIVGH